MPSADSKDWNDCVKKRVASGKYTKEVAEKVCGKMKSQLEKGSDIEEHEPSPVKKDTKEIGPVVKAWEFNPNEIMNSSRKVTGTFHVPKIDKDNEIITKAAMGEAIPDFMHLPILHDFHKERVLGVVTKVWEEADAFHFNALFKATTDVDDAWNKVQKGEYDHVSIFGARLKGNTSCGLNPQQRSVPCVSEKIRLDSISACDTNARNDSTSLTMAKAFYTDEFDIIKALSSDSSLSHGIYDGGKKGDKMKVHEADGDDVEEDEEDEEKKAFSRAGKMATAHQDLKRGKLAGNSQQDNDAVDHSYRKEHSVARGGLFEKAEEEEKKANRPGVPLTDRQLTDYKVERHKTSGGNVVESSRKFTWGEGGKKEYEKAEDFSDPDKPTPEQRKKKFAAQRSGEERSQGEDFHGGKLEKGPNRPGGPLYERQDSPATETGNGVKRDWGDYQSKPGATTEHDWTKKAYDEEEDEEKKATPSKYPHSGLAEIGTKGRKHGEQRISNGHLERSYENAKKEGFFKAEEVEKCGCEKDMLHKAKESLTGIYSMLKTILRHDKEMVEKDKEVHDKMEKADHNEENLLNMGNPSKRAKIDNRYGEGFSDNYEKHNDKRRFQKGGVRPKVTEEPVDPKKIGTSQKTNKNVEEVEKGTYSENVSGKGDLRDKKLFGPDPKFKQDVTVGSYRHESLRSQGRRSETPVKKGDEEEEVKAKDFGTRTQRTQEKNDEARLKSRFGIKERSGKEEKKASTGSVRFVDADKDDKKTYAEHRKEESKDVKKGDTMTEDVKTEEIQKANLDNEMTDEQFVQEIVKAELKNVQSTDEIVKAAVAAQVDEIRKGFETQIAELKAQLTKIEEQPMVKAAILVPEDGKIDAIPLNYEAIAQMTKRG